MSVKKYAPYRQDKGDRYRWNKKDQEKLRELKSTIKHRSGNVFGTGVGQMMPSSESGEKGRKKRKGKKERMKAKVSSSVGQLPEEGVLSGNDDQMISAVDDGDELDTTLVKKRKHEGDHDKGIMNVQTEPQKRKKRKL